MHEYCPQLLIIETARMKEVKETEENRARSKEVPPA